MNGFPAVMYSDISILKLMNNTSMICLWMPSECSLRPQFSLSSETASGKEQRIYYCLGGTFSSSPFKFSYMAQDRLGQDTPADYKSAALPTELCRRKVSRNKILS